MQLNILHTKLLPAFLKAVPTNLAACFNALQDAEISSDSFSFYTSVSSVYSSKIEGENIELDSFVKHKKWDVEFTPDYTQKIDDLYSAYNFAQQHPLIPVNLSKTHAILSQHFVQKQWQGKYRIQNMFVTTPDGKIEYVTAAPTIIKDKMVKCFEDVNLLLNEDLTIEEVFYFASIIHLTFVKTHPFNDGNGRTGRLLEKWFIAQKLGEKAWFLESEKMYYQYHQEYYNNLRALGLEYEELDYDLALPFLLMLPTSLII